MIVAATGAADDWTTAPRRGPGCRPERPRMPRIPWYGRTSLSETGSAAGGVPSRHPCRPRAGTVPIRDSVAANPPLRSPRHSMAGFLPDLGGVLAVSELTDWERDRLAALERQLSVEDPELAARLA